MPTLKHSSGQNPERYRASLAPSGGLLQGTLTLIGKHVLLVIVLLLIALFSITAEGFFSIQTWIAVTTYIPEILILALGETLVVLTGGIDLSVGAVLDFSGMAAGVAMMYLGEHHYPTGVVILLGFLASLVSGLIWGMINGFLITRTDMSPFIVTLGTFGMSTGGAYLFTSNGSSISVIPQQLGSWMNTDVFGLLPVLLLIAIALTAILWWFLKKSRFGLRAQAIGSNVRSAVVAGVNVRRHLLLVYIISGLLSGMDGFLVTSRFVTASPLAGANDLLTAIAAVIIGGASLFGGKATIWGSLLGTFVIGILLSGLVLFGLGSYWQTVATGVVIAIAVGIEQFRTAPRDY